MSLLQHIYQRLTWQSSEYSLFETVWPPPPSHPRFKNPGHDPEEEKEITELSKKESTKTVTIISAKQKQNGYNIPLYLL